MSRVHTCNALGLCQSRHCNDVSTCPDYDLLACNDRACEQHEAIAAKGLCPYKQPQRRFTDRPGCAHEAYPQPTYPFAPGVIEGPKQPDVYLDGDGPWIPLSLGETLKLLAVMLALFILSGYLVERFA